MNAVAAANKWQLVKSGGGEHTEPPSDIGLFKTNTEELV
jgi:hypothetical protein